MPACAETFVKFCVNSVRDGMYSPIGCAVGDTGVVRACGVVVTPYTLKNPSSPGEALPSSPTWIKARETSQPTGPLNGLKLQSLPNSNVDVPQLAEKSLAIKSPTIRFGPCIRKRNSVGTFKCTST